MDKPASETDGAYTAALTMLERLLALPATDLKLALTRASDLIAQTLKADKVDAFLYDARHDSLVAVGVSTQPLADLQRRLGLDVLPVSNGGRAAKVYQTGQTFLAGRLLEDDQELRGVREGMKIQSAIGVPLNVGDSRRGVVMVASLTPDFFTEQDARFAEAIGRWTGLLVHRAELIEEMARNAVEYGRREVTKELVTVLAHDLRNYLSPIQLRLTALQRRANAEQRRPDLDDITAAQSAAVRLGRMANDILDLARLDQNLFQLTPQPVELTALLRDAAAVLATPDIAVEMHTPEPMTVLADAARLRQCIDNLLFNAIRHSPSGGVVSVIVSRQAGDQGQRVHIEVSDQGPGISPEVMPRLFHRFAKGETSSSGLGLGLYLAKRIAALHGGDLSADESVGRGARFTLTLPL